MHRFYQAIFLTSIAAFSMDASNALAQVYYYPSQPNYASQSRVIVGAPTRVYSNNGIRYQSNRPVYGQTQVYSNGRYYIQSTPEYSRNGGTYYNPPSTPYYSNSRPIYNGQQGYWNQPPVTYQSGYGTGLYSTPQHAANANAGGIIGGALGGQQGAQIGAAIGGSIRP